MKKILLLLALAIVPIISFAQSALTNKSITDMHEIGLSEDIIVAKISTSGSNFDTSVEALKALKEKGIGSNIIVAMIQAGISTQAEDKENSNKPGIYFKNENEYKKIHPTTFSNAKTNTLGSATTPHISNTKIKAVLTNEHSSNVIKTNAPEFHFYFGNSEGITTVSKSSNWWFYAASSPNEFVLVRMVSKKNNRELKTGEIDLYSGNFIGVESKDIIMCSIEPMSETEFRVMPQTLILPGEYCFFYRGATPYGYSNNQAVFDFSIPMDCKIENKYNIDDSVWIIKDGKPQKKEVMSVYIKSDGIYYSLRTRSSWKGEEYKENQCYPTKEEALSNAAKEDE